MKAGFATELPRQGTDDAMLQGPVLNSGNQSAVDGSTPMSAADVSATRSTSNPSESTTGSSLVPPMTFSEKMAGGSTPELDGHDTHVKPSTELDGRELLHVHGSAAERLPAVHELPGSEVTRGKGRLLEPDRTPSNSDTSPLSLGRGEGNDSPPSPYVSTEGSSWGQDETVNSDIVSPTTPARTGARLF